jgi:hypothetical protein
MTTTDSPFWFRPFFVVLGGMIMLLFGGAPRDAVHPNWLNRIAKPEELLIFGAVLMGIGIYWWWVLYLTQQKRKRRR